MENQRITDGIYYIVLADLVGSTRFGARWGNDGLAARVLAFVAASKKALANANRSSNTGQFVKSIGDGVLLAFSHFPDVVQWDLEFDGELSLIGDSLEPLEARVCVHAGEIRFESGDPINLATNQLCKIEKSVGAGELVLTDIAYRLAVASVYPRQCQFDHHGTVRMEGYSERVKLHRLIVTADIAFLIDKTRQKKSASPGEAPERD
jgi:class 3 adenylate cyclase